MLDGSTKLEPAARNALEAQWTEACAAVMQLHAAGEAEAIPEALGATKRLLDACGDEEAVATRVRVRVRFRVGAGLAPADAKDGEGGGASARGEGAAQLLTG